MNGAFYADYSSSVIAVGLLGDVLKPILLERIIGGMAISGIARDLAFESNESEYK